MDKKSEAYHRYKSETAKGVFPYFDSDEIEQIVFDLLEDHVGYEAAYVLDEGLKMHPGDEHLTKLKILLLIHFKRVEEARQLFTPYENDGSEETQSLKIAFEIVAGRSRSTLRQLLTKVRRKQVASIYFVDMVDEMWAEIPDMVKIDYLDQATKVISDNAEALARMGAMLMDLKRFRLAIPALERALDIDAYDIYTWQDLARCAFELFDYDKCEEACDFGLAIDPENPLLHFIRGFALMSAKGDFRQALDSLLVCKKYFEGNLEHEEINIPKEEREAQVAMTYDLLGQCYSFLDKTDEAIECYEKLVAKVPDNTEVLSELSQRYLDKGDLPKALETINKAIKLKRRDTAYLSLKVSILASMHCFDEALETLDKLIKIKPSSKNFILAKAELALGIHKYEIADHEFRKLLAMKPKEATTQKMMRQYFLSIGDTDALKQMDNF